MKKKISLIFLYFILSIQLLFSQEVFKAMFYNVLNYPLQQPTSRIQDLEIIINDYLPDLFMICELNNVQGANDIFNVLTSINPDYTRAQFVLNTSDNNIGNQNDLQNMLYYDSSKFILQSQHEVTTIYRDFNHYILKLNTVNQDSNPIILNVFITHLKSSSGVDNQALRLEMVNNFITYLDNNVANDSYVILGGDLNLYTSSEPAFQELTDPSNNITFTDPANRVGSWHNNSTYVDVFTQSTRTQAGLGGATGGFDDRFDFILTSENMHTNTDIFYVNNSYQVYGNNNNPLCWNSEINTSDCSGTLFNEAIRESLYYMSDHLPVTLELQTNEPLLSQFNNSIILPIEFINGNIIKNQLKLKVNKTKNNITELYIFNSLGQKLNSIILGNSSLLNINTSHLTSGLYYIKTNNMSIKPLKFIKH